MHVIDCLLHRIIIKVCSLTDIVLKMTLLMRKQLQYWCFDICNVIEVWILLNCIGVDIGIIYHRNDLIFDAIGYIYIILFMLDAIHRNGTQKSDTSNSGTYKLSRNGIMSVN